MGSFRRLKRVLRGDCPLTSTPEWPRIEGSWPFQCGLLECLADTAHNQEIT